jgi:hypothetical protein|tara:strand:- start:4830 stop:5105 length:276 start_codon:yes stop_codon:yes gene_type:complete
MFEDQDNEEHDEIAQIQKKADMENNLHEIKDKLVRNNWVMILEKGVDFKSMKENGIEIEPVVRTLQQMLEWFQEVEEYEKCAYLKNILDNK